MNNKIELWHTSFIFAQLVVAILELFFVFTLLSSLLPFVEMRISLDIIGLLLYIYAAQIILLVVGAWKGRERDISSGQFADIIKSNKVVTVGEYVGLMLIYLVLILIGYNYAVFYHALGWHSQSWAMTFAIALLAIGRVTFDSNYYIRTKTNQRKR